SLKKRLFPYSLRQKYRWLEWVFPLRERRKGLFVEGTTAHSFVGTLIIGPKPSWFSVFKGFEG
ncbi:hypothetical protein N9L49_05735, partial [Rhodospirillales bacterium]|nr:hypothetical protein [Rhodospirillales bacterium]